MKWFLAIVLFLPACKSTYKSETIKESVKMVAQRDYKLDVEVKEAGKTLGVRYAVNDLFGEIIAEDQAIWKKMDNLIQTLSRVSLSVDVPPKFLVLEVADAGNPGNKIIFTQCVLDIRKVYAEALSRNQYFDRIVIEFEINGQRTPFDQEHLDLVSLMMMAVEAQSAPPAKKTEFELADIRMTDFLAKVAASRTRRLFRENKKAKNLALLRNANARFEQDSDGESNFNMMLELASIPGEKLSEGELRKDVLPLVTDEIRRVFQSYHFTGFSQIIVLDTNSGAMTVAPRGG